MLYFLVFLPTFLPAEEQAPSTSPLSNWTIESRQPFLAFQSTESCFEDLRTYTVDKVRSSREFESWIRKNIKTLPPIDEREQFIQVSRHPNAVDIQLVQPLAPSVPPSVFRFVAREEKGTLKVLQYFRTSRRSPAETDYLEEVFQEFIKSGQIPTESD